MAGRVISKPRFRFLGRGIRQTAKPFEEMERQFVFYGRVLKAMPAGLHYRNQILNTATQTLEAAFHFDDTEAAIDHDQPDGDDLAAAHRNIGVDKSARSPNLTALYQ